MWSEIKGTVRSLLLGGGTGPNQQAPLLCTPQGVHMVANYGPSRLETARAGRSWAGVLSSGVAPLIAVPSTTSGLTLQNPVGSPVKLIIDSVSALEMVADATQGNLLALFVAIQRNFTQVAEAGTTVVNLTGATMTRNAKCKNAATTVVADLGAWMPIGNATPVASAVAGDIWKVTTEKFDGEYIVAPGGAFHLAAVELAATAAELLYVIRWTELEMDIT